MHTFKGKGGFFVKKRLNKWEKFACMAIAAVILAGGGFMGVNKFNPEKRSLTIVEKEDSVTTSSKVSAEKNSDLKIDGKAAVLIDGVSGKVLFEQNSRKHLPPASVTKVMTLLLVMEGIDSGKIKLTDKVTVSENAASMGGSQMYMEPGEQHTVEELLKGVIMASANDGAVALAEHLHGSVESFVETMNKKAEDMGLKDSHFANTNGLPVSNHYSCAYDIGMISKELMKYQFAHKWFTTWQDSIKVGLPGKEKEFTLTNTNKLVRNYNGAIGIKTGFTDDAGYCLSGAAQRESTRLIAVVLGCETSKIRFAEMTRLLDYGFANYETVKIAEKGQRMEKISIPKSDETKIYAVTKNDIGVTVKKGSKDKTRKEISIEKNISSPVKKGQKLGYVTVYEGKEKAAEYDLVSDRDVEKADFMTIYIRMMKKLV